MTDRVSMNLWERFKAKYFGAEYVCFKFAEDYMVRQVCYSPAVGEYVRVFPNVIRTLEYLTDFNRLKYLTPVKNKVPE